MSYPINICGRGVAALVACGSIIGLFVVAFIGNSEIYATQVIVFSIVNALFSGLVFSIFDQTLDLIRRTSPRR